MQGQSEEAGWTSAENVHQHPVMIAQSEGLWSTIADECGSILRVHHDGHHLIEPQLVCILRVRRPGSEHIRGAQESRAVCAACKHAAMLHSTDPSRMSIITAASPSFLRISASSAQMSTKSVCTWQIVLKKLSESYGRHRAKAHDNVRYGFTALPQYTQHRYDANATTKCI